MRNVRDVAYAHNFHAPEKPLCFRFAPGEGREFKKALESCVNELHDALPTALENGEYRSKRDEVMLETEQRESELLSDLERQVRTDRFTIVQEGTDDQQRSDLRVILGDSSITIDELPQAVHHGSLSEEEASHIRQRYYRRMDELFLLYGRLRERRSKAETKLVSLRQEVARPIVARTVEAIRTRWETPEIKRYLKELVDDIVDNLPLFLPEGEDEKERKLALKRYGINLVLDHAETTTTPVIFERHPDFAKLFGWLEQSGDHESSPPFATIRAGSVLSAAGGYLILRAEDVIGHEEVWHAPQACPPRWRAGDSLLRRDVLHPTNGNETTGGPHPREGDLNGRRKPL